MLIQKMNRQIIFGLVTVALFLTSCNVGATPAPTLDVNAINTAIVGTTIAQLSVQFTQTALAAPTNTPAPTNTAVSLPTFALPTTEGLPTTSGALPTVSFNTTPLPGFTQVASTVVPGATVALGDECNNNAFEGDVTIPDGTVMLPGEDFTKTWAIRNTGTCTWDDGYSLVFVAGDRALDPYNYKIKNKKDFIAPGEAVNISIDLTAPLEVGKYEAHFRMMNDKGYYFGTLLSVYIEVKKKK